jgi:hypothetical protein
MSAVKIDDYYNSYRLIAAYLAYLDTYLGEPATPADKRTQQGSGPVPTQGQRTDNCCAVK